MRIRNLEINLSHEKEKIDVFLNKNREMRRSLNLTKTIIIILCEFIHEMSFFKQISRRVYRYD